MKTTATHEQNAIHARRATATGAFHAKMARAFEQEGQRENAAQARAAARRCENTKRAALHEQARNGR